MKPCKHPCCPDTGPCRKPSKRKSIYRTNRYSEKRQKMNKEYSAASKQFVKDNPVCVILSPACTKDTQGVHHKKGRGIYLMDQSTWLPACNSCNQYIEEHDQWARENGFKESRISIIK